MRVVSGTYNGTGAAVYLCLGFIPDEFHLLAAEDGDLGELHWDRWARAAEISDGILEVTGTTYRQYTAQTAGNGAEPYFGEDILTSTTQSSTTYGEGVYLGWDFVDYKADTSYGVASALTDWTLGSSANRTGNVNANTVSGSRIGEGSRILIQENTTGAIKDVFVEAWTAGQGATANQITLSLSVATGKVRYVGGMYSMKPLAVGSTTPKGVKINNTTVVNVNDEIQYFKAILHDNPM